MTFKKGDNPNPNGARKERRFYAALERAVLQDEGKQLRAAAEMLLKCAAQGEAWAINQLADRLDGKPGQVIEMNVTRIAKELDDAELHSIAAGGSDRTAGASGSAPEPAAVH